MRLAPLRVWADDRFAPFAVRWFGYRATVGDPVLPDTQITHAYDNLGRLQTVTDNKLAAPNTSTYYYDAVGNLDHFTYPNGVVHTYTYDERNRLKTLAVTANSGAALLRVQSWGWWYVRSWRREESNRAYMKQLQ